MTRTALRLVALMTTALAVVACGDTPAPDAGSGGTPGPASQVDDGDRTSESPTPAGGAEEGTAPPTGASSEVEGGDLATMPGGDGSAHALVLESLRLPEGWTKAPPDGPRYRTEVCGVQLDPEEPVDAVQRRWVYSDIQYLESEVHLFPTSSGQEAAASVEEAVVGCEGYGVGADGAETPLGQGEYDVTIQVHDGPQGWTVWTETTEETGMVRHIALAPVQHGWHWMSHVDLLGEAEPDVLVDNLPDRGQG